MAVVLHVITRAQRRGAEVAACAQRDRLAALGGDWSGGAVVALAPGRDGSPLDVPVLGTSPRGPATLAALRSRAAGADVVVAHGSATLWACAAALAGRSQPPFVYVSIGDPRYWAAGRGRRLRTKIALSRAGAVVALAPAASQALHDWYDVPADRVRVLPNTRSASEFRPAGGSERADARRRFGLPADADVVLALGSLTPEKRPLQLAMATLALPDCHVLVVGDGPLRSELEDLARRNPGRVTVAGAVADPRPALHAADALVLASASEGLPGALVEAGLCGLPAAATDVGWIGDLVVDGVSGALCRPDDVPGLTDAIERTLADRESLGAALRERCLQSCTEETVLPGWVDLLESVARRHHGQTVAR